MKNILLSLLAILIVISLGIAGMTWYLSQQINSTMPDLSLENHVEQESAIILEQVRRVFKVVAVEGDFVDIINHKEYYGIDLPGFRKKALVKVKAKVLVGYDLTDLETELDAENKTIWLKKLPEPEILAIDQDINYYDLEDGFFNSFSEKDLTLLTRAARDSIQAHAQRSKLIDKAREQADQMMDMIGLMAGQSGWTVKAGEPIKAGALDQ